MNIINPKSDPNSPMKIFSYEVNPFRENTYLLINEEKALLFDPGFYTASEMNIFLQTLQQNNATLEAILLTHAHLDHVFGIEMVRNRFEVPVYLHPEDQFFWDNYMASAAMFGFQVQPFDFNPEPLPLDPSFKMAGVDFDVRFTPGHAPGHVSYYIKEIGTVISGDALFRESVGRTDLHKGDFNILENSIRTQLYTLPDETRVLSGHGPETTIGHEKRHNPFVRTG